MTWFALAAIVYVAAYVVFRRRPARIVVICPVKRRVPRDVEARLGPAEPIRDPLPRASLSFRTLLDIEDERTLDARLGFFLRRPVTLLDRQWWVRYLRDRKWTPYALFLLALEVLHRFRPRDLVVDLRPPVHPRVARSYRNVDCGMFAVELAARVGRYSEYRDAEVSVVFANAREAWIMRRNTRSIQTPGSHAPSSSPAATRS